MTIRWDRLPDYQPPTLPNLRGPRNSFVAANITLAVAVLCLAVSASVGSDGPASWTRWVVVPVWLAVLGTGWWSCDALTRSVHLLEGRWPTRFRVGRAWAAPAIWVLVVELVVLSQGPTEVVDVRPAIAAVGLWFAAWRPFAVMRRIFLSLTRLSHDTAVMAFGLLQIAGWSLLWWLLHGLPDNGAGVAWASVMAATVAAIIPVHLGRAYDQAIAHRVLAIQTRDEHRYVRSLGLNPFHAGTYLALVMAKQERERRRGVSDPVDAVRSGHALTVAADAPAERPSKKRSSPTPRADGPEADAGESHDAFERTVDRSTDAPTDGKVKSDTEMIDANSIDTPELTEERPLTGDPLEPPSNVPSLPSQPNEPRRRIRETAASAANARGDDDRPADDRPADDHPADDEHDGPPTIGPEYDDDIRPEDAPPPRVVSLEAARYLALVTLAATAATYGWVAINSLDLLDPITAGRLSERDVDRIQQSLEWVTASVTATLPAQVIWIVMARRWIARAGRDLPLRRSELLAAATILIATTALILQALGQSTVLQATLLATAGVTCWICILLSESIATWNERTPMATRLWATAVVLVTTVHSLVGFAGTLEPDRSVQIVAFVSVLLGLIAANTAIVVGVFSLEVEDRVKSSAIVARWDRARQDGAVEESV